MKGSVCWFGSGFGTGSESESGFWLSLADKTGKPPEVGHRGDSGPAIFLDLISLIWAGEPTVSGADGLAVVVCCLQLSSRLTSLLAPVVGAVLVALEFWIAKEPFWLLLLESELNLLELLVSKGEHNMLLATQTLGTTCLPHSWNLW